MSFDDLSASQHEYGSQRGALRDTAVRRRFAVQAHDARAEGGDVSQPAGEIVRRRCGRQGCWE